MGTFCGEAIKRDDTDVWILDYPGFGKSSKELAGTGEELIQIGWEFLKEARKNYTSTPVVLFGRSLGSGIASETALSGGVEGLILETPYYSTMRLGAEMYKVIPIFLMKFKLDNSKLEAAKLNNILLLHGTKDRMISYQHSLDLQKLLGKKARLVTIKGGTHNGLSLHSGYWAELKKYFLAV